MRIAVYLQIDLHSFQDYEKLNYYEKCQLLSAENLMKSAPYQIHANLAETPTLTEYLRQNLPGGIEYSPKFDLQPTNTSVSKYSD